MTTGVSLNSTSDSNISAISNKKNSQQISSSTKRQLEALGIDSSNVTSEAQAQSLISAKQAEQSFQDSMTTNTENSSAQASNSSETSLISEAKTLAEELGVTVDSDATFDDITSAISEAIQDLMEEAENDPAKMEQAQSYMTQLSLLNSNYSSVTSANSSLYSAMNVQAANNKYMLGIS